MVEKKKSDVVEITLDDLLKGEDQLLAKPVTSMFQKSQDVENFFTKQPKFDMPPPSYRGKQIATQQQSQSSKRQKVQSQQQPLCPDYGVELKQHYEIISNPSGALLSDFRAEVNSSRNSVGDSSYLATLLKWDVLVPDDIQKRIFISLKSKMKEVTMIAMFSSKKQTYIYIETPDGIKRHCFQYKQERKGTNAIMKAEPPVPWTKTQDPVTINKELTNFLQQSYWSVQVDGDIDKAYAVIKELRELSAERKRDDKSLMKAVQGAQKQDEKNKAKNALWESIKERYLGTIVRQVIEPNEWINAEFPQDDEENEPALKLIIEGKLQCMQLYHKNACEITRPVQKYEPTTTTLESFVESYGSNENEIDCIKSVNDAGHGRLLRAAYSVLFGKITKRRTVWITGIASSGKSMFIRRLRSIFGSDEVDWRGVYLPVKKRCNSLIQTQLVTCEEFSFKHAFSDGNYHVTKMLFEGEGASVRKDLYATFEPAYKDVAFVIASNKLPGTEAQARDEAFNQDIWGPIVSRVDFVYMTKKHDEKEEFPYSTVQLARALLFLTKNQDLILKMEELDNTVIDENDTDNDIALNAQRMKLADAQQKKFAELLDAWRTDTTSDQLEQR